jgi:DNA invertase Pin-like site-specific DNA recombinase
MHILGAIAEFERARIRERVMAGLQRARVQGTRLGRPTSAVPLDRLASVEQLSLTDGGISLGVSRSTLKRWRRAHKSLSPAA